MNITELRLKATETVNKIKAEYSKATSPVSSIQHHEYRDRDLSSADGWDDSEGLRAWGKRLYQTVREQVGKYVKVEMYTESEYGVVNIDIYPELEPLKDIMFTALKDTILANPKLFGDTIQSYYGHLMRKNDDKTEMYNKRIISFARIYGIELVLTDEYNLTKFYLKRI